MNSPKTLLVLHRRVKTSSYPSLLFRNGRRTGLYSTQRVKTALHGLSFMIARAALMINLALRKWTRRSFVCQNASAYFLLSLKPAPKKTWLPSVWRPMTRRTSLQLRNILPMSGWRRCVRLLFRWDDIMKTFEWFKVQCGQHLWLCS